MLEFYWIWLKKAFPLAYSIAGIILFLLTMLTPFVTARYPQWEQKMKMSLWVIPLFVFVAFLFVRLIIAPYEIYQEKNQKISDMKKEMEAIRKNYATPDELTASHLKGLSIRISDLVREDVVIRNKIFEDCHIYGPAFITPLKDTSFEYNNFEGSLESNLIELQNRAVLGTIGLDNCVFRRCFFHRIGIIGTPDFIAKFRKDAEKK
jgi:hypothetical protein